MHKLIATISSQPSPLEEVLLKVDKNIEISVEDPNNPEEIFGTLAPMVTEIHGGDSRSALSVKIAAEFGGTIFLGSFDGGFHGTWIS